MGFCASCGEIVGAAGQCAACGHIGAAKAPVSCGETQRSAVSDAYVPTGLMASLTVSAAAEPPLSGGTAPPFHRGETTCGLCTKVITGEAVALADGRLAHSTCFSCRRCCMRIDGQSGTYQYLASGPHISCIDCGAGTLREACDVQDASETLEQSEWYFSDGDSSEGPVSLTRLKKLYAAGTLTLASFVWGTHLPEGDDWKAVKDEPELLRILQAAGGAAKPAGAHGDDVRTGDGPATAAAESGSACADACAGCGGKLTLQALVALGRSWHPDCFVCSACSKPFDGGFVTHNGEPMHKECFAAAHGPKCSHCSKPIIGAAVIVDGQKRHPGCFVCTTCECVLDGAYGLGPDERPYCAKHLAAAMGFAASQDAAGGAASATAATDRFTVDVRTGEKVYVEPGSQRRYRLGPEQAKVYEDQKPRPKYGGATSWRVA